MSRLAGLLLLALPLLAGLARPAHAQDDPPPTPPAAEAPIPRVHVVVSGETLYSIAATYGVAVEALLVANNLTLDDLIFAGQGLLIPGAAGEAVATQITIGLGDTLSALAEAYNTTPRQLAVTNRLVNPFQLVGGQPLLIVSRTGSAAAQPVTGEAYVVKPGDTLLALAARFSLSPAALAAANDIDYPGRVFAGQRLRLPGDAPFQRLPGEWRQVRVRPLPATPGSTLSLYVEHGLAGTPTGRLGDQSLHFTPDGAGYIALVGLDAFAAPGSVELTLNGRGDRPWQPFRQFIRVAPVEYGTQFINVADALSPLLDPAVRASEDAFLATFYEPVTPRQWLGVFQNPLTTTVTSAGYGAGRSYNGGPIDIFHTGVDYAAPTGTPVLAPAAGSVVFSDETTLRGQVVIVDHGLGVMTGYYHLSERLVNVGQLVTTGQILGRVGSTGLSSGAHLHWDLRVHNVPVDGRQWLSESFP